MVFTALTVWILHLQLCKVMRLASMDVSSESNESVMKFWIQWKSMLSETKGNEYRFDIFIIMVNHSVAKINSIGAVYGKGAKCKLKSCQKALP